MKRGFGFSQTEVPRTVSGFGAAHAMHLRPRLAQLVPVDVEAMALDLTGVHWLLLVPASFRLARSGIFVAPYPSDFWTEILGANVLTAGSGYPGACHTRDLNNINWDHLLSTHLQLDHTLGPFCFPEKGWAKHFWNVST